MVRPRPRRRKTATGEAKRVKIDGGCDSDVPRDTSGKILSGDSMRWKY